MNRTALIAVDVQNDCLPGGALGFPGSDSVIEPLVQLAQKADFVIASRNLHPADHMAFVATGQPYCVKGTKGAGLVPAIAEGADVVITKGMKRTQVGLSAFEASTLRPIEWLEDILAEKEITHVVVGGYWLEYAVSQTAFDANALKYQTTVALHAVQARDNDATTPTVERLEKAGVICYG